MNNLFLLLSLAAPSADVRVEGGAYLRFLREGRVVYSQATKLTIVDGRLAHAAGHRLMPEIVVPTGTRAFEVSEDGTVKLQVNGEWITSNRIVLAQFSGAQPVPDKDGLAVASGRPTLGVAKPEDGVRILSGEAAALISFKVVASDVVEAPDPPKAQPETKPQAQAPAPTTAEKPTVKPAERTPTTTSWTVPAELQVTGERVTLGDFFKFDGIANGELLAATVIDSAPPFGQSRRIERGRIEMKLRQAGVDPTTVKLTGSTFTLVTRASQAITHDTLATQAMDALKGALGDSWKITDQTRDLGPLRVREGDVTYTTSQVRVTGTTASLSVDIVVAGEKQGNRLFTYRIESLFPMPKVGSSVTVVAKSGGIRIELQGRVVRVDLASQTIEVETTERNRLTGRLVRENTVEVIL